MCVAHYVRLIALGLAIHLFATIDQTYHSLHHLVGDVFTPVYTHDNLAKAGYNCRNCRCNIASC